MIMRGIDDQDMKLLQQGAIPEHLAMSEAQENALSNYIDYLFSKGAIIIKDPQEYKDTTIDRSISFEQTFNPTTCPLSFVRYKPMLCYKILKNNGLHIYTVPYGVFLPTPKYEGYGTGLTSLVACIKPQFINGDTHME